MKTQHSGMITTWKDDKGFGFITPDQGGQQVFFHVSEIANSRSRPTVQMKVSYTLTYDQQQRPRAINVRIPQANTSLLALSWLACGIFFLVLVAVVYVLELPIWMVVGYLIASLLTFYVYGVDKTSALQKAQRVPESVLHILELLGGWPGALVAQSFYRHKTIKSSFQSAYWSMVVCNLLALVVFVFLLRMM